MKEGEISHDPDDSLGRRDSRSRVGTKIRRGWETLPEEVRSFGALAVSSMANQVVRFFTGVVNANWLTPALYGINSVAGVVTRYVSYAHLGVQNGANRRIPIEYGRGQADEAEAFASTAFWVVVGVSGVIALSVAGLYLVPASALLPRLYYPHVALLGISTLFYQFFCSWLVSTSRAGILAEMRAKFDIPAVLLTTIAVILFKLHGLLLVQSASMLTQAAVMARRTAFRPRVFSLSRALTLARQGAPILASSLVLYVFMTVDFLFVTTRYGTVEVGLYGFALTAAFFYRTYAQSMADVLQPKMGQAFGAADENPGSLSRFTIEYTYGLTPIFAMIAAVFLVGIPVLIELLLPDYQGSIGPFRALLLAELVLSLYIPSGHALTLMRRQLQLILWAIAGIAVAAIAFLYFLPVTADLSMVALLWLSVSVVVCFGIVLMAVRFSHAPTPMPWSEIGRNLVAAVAVLALLAGIGGWTIADSPVLLLLEAAARLLLLEAALVAVLLTVNPGNPIAARVRTALAAWRRSE